MHTTYYINLKTICCFTNINLYQPYRLKLGVDFKLSISLLKIDFHNSGSILGTYSYICCVIEIKACNLVADFINIKQGLLGGKTINIGFYFLKFMR